MAMWGAIIAAAIGAASNIAISSMKGGTKAPVGSAGGTEGKKFEVPDIFGKGQGGSQPPAGLAQALAPSIPAAPTFGPQGTSLYDRMNQEQKLRSLLGGR